MPATSPTTAPTTTGAEFKVNVPLPISGQPGTRIGFEGTARQQSPDVTGRRARRARQGDYVPVRVRHKLRALVDSCLDGIDRVIDTVQEPILRANSYNQLKRSLAGLWQLRNWMTEDFGEIVNMIEMLLVEREATHFSELQFETIRSVLLQVRDAESFDEDFANKLTVELMRGGLDAFREIE